jgi:hypothetical protein
MGAGQEGGGGAGVVSGPVTEGPALNPGQAAEHVEMFAERLEALVLG